MAITVDQATLGTGNQAASLTCTLTTTAAVAPGARIVVVAGRFTPNGTMSIAGGGLSWAEDHTVISGSVRTSVFSAAAPAGLAISTVLTLTHSANTPDTIMGAASYLGIDTAGPVVAFNGTATATAAWATGTIAANSGNALIGGAFVDAGAVSSSTPTGPAVERIDQNIAGQSETLTLVDKLSVAGSDSLAGAWNTTGGAVAVGVAYKDAADGVRPTFNPIPFMGGH